jgi:hypothetical protein
MVSVPVLDVDADLAAALVLIVPAMHRLAAIRTAASEATRPVCRHDNVMHGGAQGEEGLAKRSLVVPQTGVGDAHVADVDIAEEGKERESTVIGGVDDLHAQVALGEALERMRQIDPQSFAQ